MMLNTGCLMKSRLHDLRRCFQQKSQDSLFPFSLAPFILLSVSYCLGSAWLCLWQSSSAVHTEQWPVAQLIRNTCPVWGCWMKALFKLSAHSVLGADPLLRSPLFWLTPGSGEHENVWLRFTILSEEAPIVWLCNIKATMHPYAT